MREKNKLTHPQRKPVATTPASLGIPFRTVQFPSRIDHLSLHGWLLTAPNNHGRLVVMAHGFRDNRVIDPVGLPTASALYHAGISVLMFDFRDEGESPGTEVTVGIFERRDLLGAVNLAHQLGYSHVGIAGYSMGASVALEATAEDPSVQAVLADSPFADLHTYLRTNMPTWTNLPNWPFTSEILFEMRVISGLDSRQASPLTELKSWPPRPLLLIAGTADKTIPMANSKSLYQEVKSNPQDTLWIVPGATHIKAYKVNPPLYEKRVAGFFSRYLQ